MCSRNIVNQGDVLKDQERILGGLERRIKGIVVGLLSDAQTNLAQELHGIALEVMQPVGGRTWIQLESRIPLGRWKTTEHAAEVCQSGAQFAGRNLVQPLGFLGNNIGVLDLYSR